MIFLRVLPEVPLRQILEIHVKGQSHVVGTLGIFHGRVDASARILFSDELRGGGDQERIEGELEPSERFRIVADGPEKVAGQFLVGIEALRLGDDDNPLEFEGGDSFARFSGDAPRDPFEFFSRFDFCENLGVPAIEVCCELGGDLLHFLYLPRMDADRDDRDVDRQFPSVPVIDRPPFWIVVQISLVLAGGEIMDARVAQDVKLVAPKKDEAQEEQKPPRHAEDADLDPPNGCPRCRHVWSNS